MKKMSYEDWELSLEYINFACSEFPNVTWEAYSMYDGRRGFYLMILDSNGNEYDRVATGVRDNFSEMKLAINAMIRRLLIG